MDGSVLERSSRPPVPSSAEAIALVMRIDKTTIRKAIGIGRGGVITRMRADHVRYTERAFELQHILIGGHMLQLWLLAGMISLAPCKLKNVIIFKIAFHSPHNVISGHRSAVVTVAEDFRVKWQLNGMPKQKDVRQLEITNGLHSRVVEKMQIASTFPKSVNRIWISKSTWAEVGLDNSKCMQLFRPMFAQGEVMKEMPIVFTLVLGNQFSSKGDVQHMIALHS